MSDPGLRPCPGRGGGPGSRGALRLAIGGVVAPMTLTGPRGGEGGGQRRSGQLGAGGRVWGGHRVPAGALAAMNGPDVREMGRT
jgi:hypothetical protein